jgi:hypothetical protein
VWTKPAPETARTLALVWRSASMWPRHTAARSMWSVLWAKGACSRSTSRIILKLPRKNLDSELF